MFCTSQSERDDVPRLRKTYCYGRHYDRAIPENAKEQIPSFVLYLFEPSDPDVAFFLTPFQIVIQRGTDNLSIEPEYARL